MILYNRSYDTFLKKFEVALKNDLQHGSASKFSKNVADRHIPKLTKFHLHCIYRKNNYEKSNLPFFLLVGIILINTIKRVHKQEILMRGCKSITEK